MMLIGVAFDRLPFVWLPRAGIETHLDDYQNKDTHTTSFLEKLTNTSIPKLKTSRFLTVLYLSILPIHYCPRDNDMYET